MPVTNFAPKVYAGFLEVKANLKRLTGRVITNDETLEKLTEAYWQLRRLQEAETP